MFSNDGVYYSQNNEFVGLGAGNFGFFVTDDNGCQEAIEVSVGAPDAILVTANVSHGSLDGEGTIDVAVVGGQPPYSFEWSGPGVFGVDTPYLENISTGLYTVEVTDSLGCTAEETLSIQTSSLGCIDPEACNFVPNASVDDDTCDYSCYGCADPEALNYNPDATIDDGGCIYFTPNCASIGEEGWLSYATGVYPQTLVELEFGLPASFEFVLHFAAVIEEPSTGQIFAVDSFEPQMVSGLPNGLELMDALEAMGPNAQQCVQFAGTPTQEGSFDIEIEGVLTIQLFGTPYVVGNYSFTQTIYIYPNVNGIPGCMYAFATNYNPIATYDDGSCELVGCTDPAACNHNISATSDNGSCDYSCKGCTYVQAENYNPGASQDDGSCTFEITLGSCVFDTNDDQYIGSEDLLNFLSVFGSACSEQGFN